MDWTFFAVAAMAGIVVKLVDQIEDVVAPKSPASYWMRYPLAFLYGMLIGCVISFSPFASLWLAALGAQFITGKIDKPSHFLGFFTAMAFALIFGVAQFSMLDFFILLAFAAADEVPAFQVFGPDLRPALKFATFVFGIAGNWDYFIAIMVFDASYYVSGRAFNREFFRNR